VITETAHTAIQSPEPINYIDVDLFDSSGNVCMNYDNYKNLSENMLEIERYIKQNSIIIIEHNNLFKEELK